MDSRHFRGIVIYGLGILAGAVAHVGEMGILISIPFALIAAALIPRWVRPRKSDVWPAEAVEALRSIQEKYDEEKQKRESDEGPR